MGPSTFNQGVRSSSFFTFPSIYSSHVFNLPSYVLELLCSLRFIHLVYWIFNFDLLMELNHFIVVNNARIMISLSWTLRDTTFGYYYNVIAHDSSFDSKFNIFVSWACCNFCDFDWLSGTFP